ncbi:MAG: 50S ribosomal protein L29 [Candidatus Hodarchaeota archaeon]
MAKLSMAEIREMSIEERERKLSDFRSELAKHRAAMMSGSGSENPGAIGLIRKNIARILTVINEEKRLATIEGREEEEY